MKLPLPLLLIGGAALLFFAKSKKSEKTYKVVETDDVVTYVILKDGDKFWQFGIPTADVGKRIGKVPTNASPSSQTDYDLAVGPVYQT